MSVVPKERLYVVIGLDEESYRMNAVRCRSYLNNNIQTLCNFPHMKCFCTKKKYTQITLTFQCLKMTTKEKRNGIIEKHP